MRTCIALVIAVGFLATTATGQDDAVTKEKAKLKGNWKVISLEQEGDKAPEEIVKKMRLEFTADKTIMRGVGEKEKDEEAAYTIDPAKKPAQMEITPSSGPEKGMPTSCIYLLDGDDLKICAASKPDKPRPKEFDGKKGANTTLIILKREKK